jgi:hypothetical protein
VLRRLFGRERTMTLLLSLPHSKHIARMNWFGTLMFDNSRGLDDAFTLARAQARRDVLYDCRDQSFKQDAELARIAGISLAQVAPP